MLPRMLQSMFVWAPLPMGLYLPPGLKVQYTFGFKNIMNSIDLFITDNTIYTSSNYGSRWSPASYISDKNVSWTGITSSANGSKVAACTNYGNINIRMPYC